MNCIIFKKEYGVSEFNTAEIKSFAHDTKQEGRLCDPVAPLVLILRRRIIKYSLFGNRHIRNLKHFSSKAF